MLRQEQSDLLTQTGPGTPGGKLFRSYWMPALLADELPRTTARRCGEAVVRDGCWRSSDSEGRLGLIDEFLRPPRRLAVVRPQRG